MHGTYFNLPMCQFRECDWMLNGDKSHQSKEKYMKTCHITCKQVSTKIYLKLDVDHGDKFGNSHLQYICQSTQWPIHTVAL